MTHTLKIEPAVEPELRHKIQDLLKKEGFSVHGGGTCLVGQSCSDITFSKKEEISITSDDVAGLSDIGL